MKKGNLKQKYGYNIYLTICRHMNFDFANTIIKIGNYLQSFLLKGFRSKVFLPQFPCIFFVFRNLSGLHVWKVILLLFLLFYNNRYNGHLNS